MNPDDLIRIARHLATGGVSGGRGRPRQADLCRAVSTAYYALFHALARCCADMLVGSAVARRRQNAWDRMYRALEHGLVKNQCNDLQQMQLFPPDIQGFGRHFVAMQRFRHQADYAPHQTFSRSQTLELINECERVIPDLRGAPAIDQRAFAVHILFRTRRD